MTTGRNSPVPDEDGGLAEERFCLREMLEDVARERRTGGFGKEKLRQADIRKVIAPKPRKNHATGT